MLRKIRPLLGPILGLILFAAATWILLDKLQEITWEEFREGITGVPPTSIVLAVLMIALNYALLITYDILALRSVGAALPVRKIALVGFLGYALGNNLGTLVAGTPLRFRLYTAWGLETKQIMAIIAYLGITFWTGVFWLGGLVLLFVPIPVPQELRLPITPQTLGGILLSCGIIYALLCARWKGSIPAGGIPLRLPNLEMMILQTSVAALDLTVSAIALYLVLPGSSVVPFATVLAAYLIGITASLVTQVPGGLVVLELILLNLLAKDVGNAVSGSLLIFRLLYYVIPLIVAIILLGAYEGLRTRQVRHRPE